MAGASDSFHEPFELLSSETRDMHRALVSLQEELEAVDWYRQRADVCTDDELREILLHNMREEMEHAVMVLEWLRRRNSDFSSYMDTYLYTKAPIIEVEEADTDKSGTTTGQPEEPAEQLTGGGFTIGSLKKGRR
ncbi:encapsulin-associated ferritin-like protein [Alkalilimnicola sp. S0819]|uniref:encapsulin-associated ferritin-like protein n=1 Tax=Alkalilimnicola sp. S0819 TaxID=2613922 RepID=UPI001261ECB2|nr:ferritin-like domain-containing protein [Alkalilimnicola sp. S0819]KAB7624387.1 ferritin [Alkalilimnicola sp. S0819]MPQ16214.1 ferritin [Alkalilimnicola sp. S0819]